MYFTYNTGGIWSWMSMAIIWWSHCKIHSKFGYLIYISCNKTQTVEVVDTCACVISILYSLLFYLENDNLCLPFEDVFIVAGGLTSSMIVTSSSSSESITRGSLLFMPCTCFLTWFIQLHFCSGTMHWVGANFPWQDTGMQAMKPSEFPIETISVPGGLLACDIIFPVMGTAWQIMLLPPPAIAPISGCPFSWERDKLLPDTARLKGAIFTVLGGGGLFLSLSEDLFLFGNLEDTELMLIIIDGPAWTSMLFMLSAVGTDGEVFGLDKSSDWSDKISSSSTDREKSTWGLSVNKKTLLLK